MTLNSAPYALPRPPRSPIALRFSTAALLISVCGLAQASICDHRPTKVATRAAAASSGTVVAAGASLKALGFYTP